MGLGPGLHSLSLDYSLQGGADQPAPTRPMQQQSATRTLRQFSCSLDPSAFVMLLVLGSAGLIRLRLETARSGWVSLPARLPIGEPYCAKVRKLAISIMALCPIVTKAEGLIATLELQVAHGLCKG